MLQSVKGIYRQGKFELLETPNNLEESSVIITFLEDKPIQKYPKLIYRRRFFIRRISGRCR
jgi:hypothetical protein